MTAPDAAQSARRSSPTDDSRIGGAGASSERQRAPELKTTRPIGLAPGAPEAAAGQDAKKYATANPVVQRLLARWMGRLRDVLGLEYRVDKVLLARERLPKLAGAVADAGMLPVIDGAGDLVTCIELLEHLEPFDPAVGELARITGGRLVVSVPWEPWFRLGNLGRGKNLRRLGNDPEHVQAFTPRRLHRALERHYSEVRVVKAFPWLIAEARRPR